MLTGVLTGVWVHKGEGGGQTGGCGKEVKAGDEGIKVRGKRGLWEEKKEGEGYMKGGGRKGGYSNKRIKEGNTFFVLFLCLT